MACFTAAFSSRQAPVNSGPALAQKRGPRQCWAQSPGNTHNGTSGSFGWMQRAGLGVLACAACARFQRNLSNAARQERQRRSKLRRHAVDAGTPKELGEWCALYINLDRRQDRQERLMELLAKLNGPLLARLERVQAVDKQNLSFEDEEVVGAVAPHALERARRAMEEEHYTIVHDEEGNLVHFDDHLTLGGIACALSHRLALRRIAEHPTAEWGLVLEDDVNALVPRVDLAIAKLLSELPDDWDAVCLAYHDPQGRVHPEALSNKPLEDSFNGSEVEVLSSPGHVFGLGAWMVRKEAAQQLVENAFPIESQVDYTLTNWLARFRRRLWKVDPTNLLLYAPSSEEEMDSDVQTMVPIAKIEEDHQSLQAYIDYMNGRPLDPYADWDLEDLGYGDDFDEEEWIRQWQEQRYEEYYGRLRSEG